MIIRDPRFRIEQALFELMQDMSFPEISVNQIVVKARCSRATFYRIYSSKKDVAIAYLAEIFDDLHSRRNSMEIKDFYLEVFKYMRLDKERITLLLDNGFLPDMLDQMNRTTIGNPPPDKNEDTLKYYQACALNGMIFNITYAWAKEGFKTEPEVLLEAILARTL